MVLRMVGSSPQNYLEPTSFNQRPSTTTDHRSPPITFPITIFWTEEHLPARLLQLLLQMAGVERNPGPTTTWICSVCNQPLHCNITSVKCNGCSNWCHMRRCTNLTSHRNWSSTFKANCCSNTNSPTSHVQRTNPPSNISSQSQLVNTHFNFAQIQRTSQDIASFKILQFNCNGLTRKLDEIINYT
uniref:Uncharacterized protein n=1 Tax=Cacopsylla melanoneura TaxID=428564 RepID=A0A8D8QYK6_9HEMI